MDAGSKSGENGSLDGLSTQFSPVHRDLHVFTVPQPKIQKEFSSSPRFLKILLWKLVGDKMKGA